MDEKETEIKSLGQNDTIKNSSNNKISKFQKALITIIIIAIISAIVVVSLSQTGYIKLPGIEFPLNLFSSIKLDEPASLESEWGTSIEYKIDADWTELGLYTSESSSSVSYYGRQNGEIFNDHGYVAPTTYISITMRNPEVGSSSTTDDWIDGIISYNEFLDDTSIDEFTKIDTQFVTSGEPSTFEIFKLTGTTTLSDSELLKKKVEDPNAKQSSTETHYFAVLKNRHYDIEIDSEDESLLRDFLDTLTITSEPIKITEDQYDTSSKSKSVTD